MTRGRRRACSAVISPPDRSSFSLKTCHPLLPFRHLSTDCHPSHLHPSSHLFLVVSAGDPPLTGEVKSRKGKHFLLRHEEASWWCVPPTPTPIWSLSVLTTRPIVTRGIQGHGLSSGGWPPSVGLDDGVPLGKVGTGYGEGVWKPERNQAHCQGE